MKAHRVTGTLLRTGLVPRRAVPYVKILHIILESCKAFSR